jgi:diguanylate cyclase (GGDEF)-like protein
MDEQSKLILTAIQNSLGELAAEEQGDAEKTDHIVCELQKLAEQLYQLTRNLNIMKTQAVDLSDYLTDDVNVPVCSDNLWNYRIFRFLDLLHIGVLIADSSSRVIYANRPAKEKLGDRDYHIIQKENDILGFIALNQEDSIYPLSREIYDKGCQTWFRLMSDSFFLPNGNSYYFNTIEDISEWKINENLLKKAAKTDEMTGTLNRKTGLEELEKLLSITHSRKIYSIAFIDIDGLKMINDSYGHSEGDYAIKSIAAALLSSVRDSDIVCRYGGDEFFIILNNCTEKLAEKAFARMSEKLSNLEQTNPKPFPLSFSYGIVSFTNNTNSNYTAADLLKLADYKMYLSKNKKAGTTFDHLPL